MRAVVLEGLGRMLVALEAGDAAAAEEAMRSHLANAKQILLDLTEREPCNGERFTAFSWEKTDRAEKLKHDAGAKR